MVVVELELYLVARVRTIGLYRDKYEFDLDIYFRNGCIMSLWVMGVEAPGFVSFFLNVFVKILPRKRSYYLFRAVVFTKEIHIEYKKAEAELCRQAQINQQA